jgi:hypothetical protein
MKSKKITGEARKPRTKKSDDFKHCKICDKKFRDMWGLTRHYKGKPDKHREILDALGYVNYTIDDYKKDYQRPAAIETGDLI